MLDAIGSLLPAAAGIALSPFPIIAIVVLLGSSRGLVNGLAFTGGWLIGLGALTTVVVTLARTAGDASGDTPTAIAWLRIVLGAALLALAVRKLLATTLGDHDDADGPATPRWMAGIDGTTPGRALGIGLLLGGVNPKNIAFTAGSAPTIAIIGMSSGRIVGAAVLYVVLASSALLAMMTARLVAPAASESALRGVERFMLAHSTAITIAILALLGAKLLGDGIAGL